TGLPTQVSQGDVQQAIWGTHGDHPVIVLSAISVPDCLRMTIRAFNLAEKYRVPVVLLTDEVTGHMRERVEIPEVSSLEIVNRKVYEGNPSDYVPFEVTEDKVPRFAEYGSGIRYHVTGLTHNIMGFPTTKEKEVAELQNRLMTKISDNADHICVTWGENLEGAEDVIISYGCVARSAKSAARQLNSSGKICGTLILETLWPFPDEQVLKAVSRAKRILVPELNFGQVAREIERVVKGKCELLTLQQVDGQIITPKKIMEALSG
ncbi:MAG: 2-oxoacid:acceptor oxidoreductase subunit alpha, partial [bacterium]